MSAVLCTYCGVSEATTKDHVIPALLFPEGKRESLITVPSCLTCNNGFSKDEEDFRLMLMSTLDVMAISPRAIDVFNGPVMRSFNRGHFGTNHINRIRSRINGVAPVPSDVGEGIGYLPTFKYSEDDISRYKRVVMKIVKGLLYDSNQIRFPDDYEGAVFLNVDEDFLRLPLVQAVVAQGKRYQLGDGVFECARLNVENDINYSLWLMCFYSGFFVSIITGPKAKIQEKKQKFQEEGRVPVDFNLDMSYWKYLDLVKRLFRNYMSS